MSEGVVAGESDAADFRMQVVAESIRLFAEQGYESTTVDAVAAAAGVSRRTLFRQFRSKEDFIFADHEQLLVLVAEQLADAEESGADPWWSVCVGAERVFAHFATHRDLAAGRYRVVSRVPALRDRELVTTYRYQRLFEESLRRRLPDVPRVRQVAYAAAVTGAHNHLLRQMVRGDESATADALRAELQRIHSTMIEPVHRDSSPGNAVTVVMHGADLSADDVADIVRKRLTWHAVP
ncbi:TetR/AcrR family transcriptional regulator [Gordonia sp. HY442]|uniref:TetR/AcrR family transcriptional regulator n=1 Tax=Gordonia zhenghanii TaxID=2911516 RepID=UPI001F484131|nr:TetR/AcrR family transcriptional regulator [Gordonia zhenghanii]MCF8606600.1 TetR/AcrR family transcriptional regulator [Gordonia zhenghanii]